MIVIVDLADSTISLDEPGVLDAFKVTAGGNADVAAVAQVLEDAGVGSASDEVGHVWVSIAAVRLLAEDQVDEGWADKFDAMVDGAQTKGWVSGDGASIRAHLD